MSSAASPSSAPPSASGTAKSAAGAPTGNSHGSAKPNASRRGKKGAPKAEKDSMAPTQTGTGAVPAKTGESTSNVTNKTNNNSDRHRGNRGGKRNKKAGGRTAASFEDAVNAAVAGQGSDTDALNNNTGGATRASHGTPEVSVKIPHAFSMTLENKRIRERGRLFRLPSNWTPSKHYEFAVVERTIVGIDDILYNRSRTAWEHLSRGNARVFLKSPATAPSAAAAVAGPGNAHARYHTDEGGQKDQTFELVGAVNGLRKFGYNDNKALGYGGTITDGGALSPKYDPDQRITHVVAIEKENGECGHVSAFTVTADRSAAAAAAPETASASADAAAGVERYWVLGSKNVHIVVRFDIPEEDVRYYEESENSKRYGYATRIARLFRDLYLKPQPRSGESSASAIEDRMRRFHAAVAAGHYTCCCEAIFSDSQHLVDYHGENMLKFYALAQNDMSDAVGECVADDAVPSEQSNSDDEKQEKAEPAAKHADPAKASGTPSLPDSLARGLCTDVFFAESLFTSFGLPFSTHSALTAIYATGPDGRLGTHFSEEYRAMLEEIGKRANSEGCVMYGYANGTRADGSKGPYYGRVLRLWKEKSYPYVMERAAREAITQHLLCGRQLRERLAKKLAQQEPSLRRYFNAWEAERLPWLCAFSSWLQMRRVLYPAMRAARDGNELLFAVRNQWLTHQHNFQAELDADPGLMEACDLYQAEAPADASAVRNDDMDVIMFVGPQGCGKSTLSRALFALLRECPDVKAGEEEKPDAPRKPCRPRWVNQDESGNRNNFLSAITAALKKDPAHPERNVTHLMIDKMNLTRDQNRRDYGKLPLTLVLNFCHPELGKAGMLQVCYDRVIARGAAHRTIRLPAADGPRGAAEVEAQKANIWRFTSKAVYTCQEPRPEDLPDDGGDVEAAERILQLDVTAPLEDLLALAWERLRRVGHHALPPIDPATSAGRARLLAAIALAQRYEALLASQERAPLYGCVAVSDPAAVSQLLSMTCIGAGSVAEHLRAAGMKTQEEFHVTTKYFVGDPDPVMFVALAERTGQEVELHAGKILADNKGACITVINDVNDDGGKHAFPCANEHPHITLANRPGVPPKYSSELIDTYLHGTDEQKREINCVDLPPGTFIKGKFTFR